MTQMLEAPSRPDVEIRSGAAYQVAEVNFPKRIVTAVAMPYERSTTIHERDRSYQEIVSRGAFAGTERRGGQIRVNRDHSWEKPVGKIIALHPSRSEGLVVDVKITGGTTPYPLGDHTLALCDDGVLSASAGFLLLRRDGGEGPVYEDAEVWERSGSLRRLNKLWLDHLAFVPNPAYDDATIVDVRNTPGSPQEAPGRDARPNFEQIRVRELEADYDALDKRWLRQ